ncbi:UNVERIFIED_CONTAM: transcriptional regulator with PAS, ATPase and Fis domain [Brevibacillus sp. OAP136]
MNSLVLLTGSTITRTVLHRQLEEIIGDYVGITSFSIEEGLPENPLENQFIVLSHKLAETIPSIQQCIGPGCKVISGKRIINYENIDKLLCYPTGTSIMFINDSLETCMETIESLQELGINHLHYIPCYPGNLQFPKVDIAVAPSNFHQIPPYVKEVIRINPRLLDISTIIQILDHFHLTEPGNVVSQRYMRKIIQLSKRLVDAMQKANDSNHHLHQVLNGVNDGILSVNKAGYITVFNEELGHLLNVKPERAIGKKLLHVLDNPELVAFIQNTDKEEDRWFSLGQIEVVVHRFQLDTDQSSVATFKNARKTIELEKRLQLELQKKGYIAKHTMADIVGQSGPLVAIKEKTMKLAKTELPILIEGESGTGKELFASAIHNCSQRSKGPFLAVNFSAISEDLLESELFGYEDGAFTGAKKGGKVGLFEQANGGTIFLDEIGDTSLKLQARLLRVLQEKEIMRIGGSKIIPIDVRIVAATNKDLLTMISLGKFREDLYHRLKVLFLHLPVLRERSDDIPLLIKSFMKRSGAEQIRIMPDVIEQLKAMPWYGNVRELKNTIDYMQAVCDGNLIRLSDIPNKNSFQESLRSVQSTPAATEYSAPASLPALFTFEDEELLSLLDALYAIRENGQIPNRKRLVDLSQTWRKPLTEQQVRYRLNLLEQRGYIQKNRGRIGTTLTPSGVAKILENRAKKPGM